MLRRVEFERAFVLLGRWGRLHRSAHLEAIFDLEVAESIVWLGGAAVELTQMAMFLDEEAGGLLMLPQFEPVIRRVDLSAGQSQTLATMTRREDYGLRYARLRQMAGDTLIYQNENYLGLFNSTSAPNWLRRVDDFYGYELLDDAAEGVLRFEWWGRPGEVRHREFGLADGLEVKAT